MFELFGWSSIVNGINQLPKEVTYAGLAYFALNDIIKRIAQVKIEQSKSETRKAELEVEALKLQLELEKLKNLNPQT